MNLFTKGLKSEYGNVMIVSLSFSAAFAAASASSFPRIPTWLGTQQNNNVWFISAEYFPNTSKTKGWLMCCCSIACRHDKESTQITYLSLLELFTTFRASWIVRSFVVYMDACNESFSAPAQWLLICFNIKTFHGRCSKCPKRKPDSLMVWFDFIECFTTTFLRAHSWLNWVDEDDDEHDEVGLKEKPEDTRYIKKITSK